MQRGSLGATGRRCGTCRGHRWAPWRSQPWAARGQAAAGPAALHAGPEPPRSPPWSATDSTGRASGQAAEVQGCLHSVTCYLLCFVLEMFLGTGPGQGEDASLDGQRIPARPALLVWLHVSKGPVNRRLLDHPVRGLFPEKTLWLTSLTVSSDDAGPGQQGPLSTGSWS